MIVDDCEFLKCNITHLECFQFVLQVKTFWLNEYRTWINCATNTIPRTRIIPNELCNNFTNIYLITLQMVHYVTADEQDLVQLLEGLNLDESNDDEKRNENRKKKQLGSGNKQYVHTFDGHITEALKIMIVII